MDDQAIRDVFSGLGEVRIKRMFGGRGIYHHGLIFALEVDGELLLKADVQSASDFLAAGAKQWVYEGHIRKGRVAMPYWTVPDAAVDDPDEMAVWAHRAYEAALRSVKRGK